MDERDGATSQKVNTCMYISIYTLPCFFYINPSEKKKCLIDDVIFKFEIFISFIFIL